MIKGAIFDIDGTLVDSVGLHARAWRESLAKFGHDVPFDAVRQQIGKGGDQLLPVFLTREEQEKYGKQLEEYRGQLFQRDYLPLVKPFPRVRELFQRLRENGKQIVLASSAKSDEIEAYKRIAHIEDLVEEQTSSDDVSRSKPNPEIFEVALKRLHGVDPAQAIAVGDSPYDAIAASKLKITCIGMLSGGFAGPELRAAGCSVIYEDCADLLKHYEGSLCASKRAA